MGSRAPVASSIAYLVGFVVPTGRAPMRWRIVASALSLIGYDALVRPALLDWGATDAERRIQLPGDEIV